MNNLKALQYEVTGSKLTTKRGIERLKKSERVIDNMSSWAILVALYHRHDKDVWAFAFFFSWAVYAWVELGR